MKKFFIGALCVVLSTSAFAGEYFNTGDGSTSLSQASEKSKPTPRAKTSGFYVGALGGYGLVNEDVENADTSSNSGFAWNVNAGYQFVKQLALEVGFNAYPDQSYSTYLGDVDGNQNHATYLALKGIVPFPSGGNFYGKLGVASVHNNITGPVVEPGEHKATTAYYALGFSVPVNQHVHVNVELSSTMKDDPVPAMYFAGAGLTFSI